MSSTLKIRLFQADVSACGYAFRPLETARKACPGAPVPADYRHVYETDVPAGNGPADDRSVLEQLFTALNRDDRPGRTQFRSMSVSDVAVISDGNGPDRAYYCNSIGFEPVDFDTSGF